MKNFKHNSFLCAGIDPDLDKFPSWVNINHSHSTLKFLQNYIFIVYPHINSFKIQKAFFDYMDNGNAILKRVIDFCHSLGNKPVLVDCKIGDIGNTMDIYLKNIFGKLGADGVVVNPYMGDDVFEFVEQYSEKYFLPLIKTSNPNSTCIQEQKMENGNPLWFNILQQTLTKWNKAGNIVPILSGTENINDLNRARQLIPDEMPIFFAGVGTQGQNISLAKLLLNRNKDNLIVNVSRDLMYHNSATNQNEYNAMIMKKVLEYKENLEALKQDKGLFLLLAGVSGVGKSAVIHFLKDKDNRYQYISPDITRPLRKNEDDKHSINENEFAENERKGYYWNVNRINNVSYGSPREDIQRAIDNGQIALLDFPIQKINEAKKNFFNVRTIYIEPPSLNELKKRLSYDNRDKDGKRYLDAVKELQEYSKGQYDQYIDIKFVAETDAQTLLADQIHNYTMSQIELINNFV